MSKSPYYRPHYVVGYKCTLCDQEFEEVDFSAMTCPHCGEKGILDVLYDYEGLRKHWHKEELLHNKRADIWRYEPLLPVVSPVLERTLSVGMTPLYDAPDLAAFLDIKELYIKDEGLNPTGSLKDRASVIAAIKAKEKELPILACSSTGNAASSLAGNCARLGQKTVIFVPKRAPVGKLTQLLIYGATVVVVEGDYKDAYNLSKAAIDHYGWYNRNAAINPYLVEGKKTVALEIAEQMKFEMPDWVAVSVGDGCTIGGVYKGFYDLLSIGFIDKMPKLLGVQAKGCAPIAEAFHSEQPLKEWEENTFADSIAVGIPRNPEKALNAARLSHGTYVTVSDEAIKEAMRTLGAMEGVFGEPAGVTALAGVKEAVATGIIASEETVVAIMTGNGLKDPVSGQKAAGSPLTCKPDLRAFVDLYEERPDMD